MVSQAYSGESRYLTDLQVDAHRLLVAIPCLIGDSAETVYALLDMASEWCVLGRAQAETLSAFSGANGSDTYLHTRFGLIAGRLERIALRLPAATGDDLVTEATWFVSADWPGPTVLGWRGCLERLRTGLDPGRDAFLFAEL